MEPYRVGIIGCGRSGSDARKPGEGLSHRHAKGYETSDKAVIVAAADIVEEYAKAYQEQHDVATVYTDYHEMLASEELDIVSIVTWPHLHADMVVAAAESGVKAIHCEKPMALTYGDAKRMVASCEENGVQLTIDHQRRFGSPFRKTRELVEAGAIGDLLSIESRCSNLYDWGTHWFDMQFFFNNQTPVEWVMGQIDLEGSRQIFGAWMEGYGVSRFKFANDVYGLLLTGEAAGPGPSHRLVGTEGVIEVAAAEGQVVRMMNAEASGWQNIDVEGNIHGDDHFTSAVLDAVDALAEGREPELAGRKALQATELIFATYESSYRRARVDLPLEYEGSRLYDMLGKNPADAPA